MKCGWGSPLRLEEDHMRTRSKRPEVITQKSIKRYILDKIERKLDIIQRQFSKNITFFMGVTFYFAVVSSSYYLKPVWFGLASLKNANDSNAHQFYQNLSFLIVYLFL